MTEVVNYLTIPHQFLLIWYAGYCKIIIHALKHLYEN